jgi:hypothetical protein
MTFKLSQSKTFEWPVSWQIPGDMKPIECTFTGVFRRLTTEEMRAVLTDEAGIGRTDEVVARELLVDWKHVQGADDKPLAFSGPALDQLLAVVGARGAIVEAFLDAHSGGLARKNS